LAVTNPGLRGLYDADPRVKEIVDDKTLSCAQAAVLIANGISIQTSERAVRRLRARLGHPNGRLTPNAIPERLVESQTPRQIEGSASLVNGGKEGTLNVVLPEPIVNDNWDHVFEHFNLDPKAFYIVGDTVNMKMSKWEQSKRTDSGDRDMVQLSAYSYSAAFKRRSDEQIRPEVFAQWRAQILDRPFEPVLHTNLAIPRGTYLLHIADPQLGKKGTEEAVENWKHGVRCHKAEIQRLTALGQPVEAVHVSWLGDETEGVANNYGNQPHTIELNQTQQLELDFDLRMWTLREMLELGLPVKASSVISNHGEWTRNGSKDVVTTKNDNASTHIARQVKKAFAEMEPFGIPHIEWTIGDSTPGIVVNLSGVDNYLTHGYIEKGRGSSTETRTRAAVERQILGDTPLLGSVPLWWFAHYHHFYTNEFEGRTLFGVPALEAERSSEYMLHQFGVWSPAGSLGAVVGDHLKRGWSNINVF
jgi:hypothetical protein